MRLLTIDQAAEATQFCRNTIKTAIKSGELRHGKFGRLVRIREEDLAEWVAQKIEGTMRLRLMFDQEIEKLQVIEKTLTGRQWPSINRARK